MSFQAPISISDVISRMDGHRLLLPAIQREFIWESEKIEWLFDSLLRGYPIGSFLFWEVRDRKDKVNYRYYEFLRNYRERYSIYITQNSIPPDRPILMRSSMVNSALHQYISA